LAGAAWATVIAQWFGALWFLGLLYKQREAFCISLELPSLHDLRPFLKIGWELALRTSALILTFTLATAVASRVGILEVAAHQVAAELWVFMALVVDALAIAAQALVARYLGEGKEEEARAVSDRLLFFGLLIGLALGLAFWLLRDPLPRLFTADPAIIQRVKGLFPFLALMQPLNALVFVWDGIFMGAESFAYLALAMLASTFAAAIVLLLVVPLGWGLTGVWWGLIVLMLMRLLTLWGRYGLRGLTKA
jgi:MATE family multidrug resistance protein